MNCWTPSVCCKLLYDRVKLLGSSSSIRVKLGTSFPSPTTWLDLTWPLRISAADVAVHARYYIRVYGFSEGDMRCSLGPGLDCQSGAPAGLILGPRTGFVETMHPIMIWHRAIIKINDKKFSATSFPITFHSNHSNLFKKKRRKEELLRNFVMFHFAEMGTARFNWEASADFFYSD